MLAEHEVSANAMLRYAIGSDNQKARLNGEFGLDGIGRFCKNPPTFLRAAWSCLARNDSLALIDVRIFGPIFKHLTITLRMEARNAIEFWA
jgi:hypothetical protein